MSERRRGIEGIESTRWEKDVERCQAMNWVGLDQCNHMTHWVCKNCDRRVCGTHATWHKGDWRSGCSGSQIKIFDGKP